MKTTFNKWFNLLLAALITTLGFGACKSNKGTKGLLNTSRSPVPEEIEDVYGPPPMYGQPELPDEPKEGVLEMIRSDSI